MTRKELLELIVENAVAMQHAAAGFEAHAATDPVAEGIALGYRETAAWLLALVERESAN